MPAIFSRVKTWGSTDTLTAADLNAEFDNILTNLVPLMLDDYSVNVTQMQVTTDPGEVGTESLATTLAGELARLRFAIKDIKGSGVAQWYATPTATLTDLLAAVGGSIISNRIVSGVTSANSNAPRFLVPAGNAATLTLDGTPTNFVYVISGTQYTISADTTLTSMSTAPSSNNTALVNDTSLTAQESSKWQGEDGTVITMDTVGSEISNLTGKYAAFKVVHGGNTEYFIGYVASSTQITNCLRGCFLDSTLATSARTGIADNDTITLMNLSWIFATTSSALAVSYVNPTISYTAPSGTTGYWFDIANSLWKTYNGSAWVTANALLIGVSAQDTSNCKVARAFDFYGAYDNYSNIILDYGSATTVIARNFGGKIGVGTSLIAFQNTKSVWDITANLESGYAEAASTTYFVYVGESGQLKLSPNKPYYSAGMGRGWYHPYENWRAVGYIQNDGSQNFDANTVFTYASDLTVTPVYEVDTLKNVGFTATVASNALTVTLTAADGTPLGAGNAALVNFRSATSTTGTTIVRRIIAPIAVTAPTSATLGTTSALAQHIWVYLIDDAGVVDIGLSFDVFDESVTASATAISAAATSGTVLYSVSAHTTKAIRLIGRILITEAAAGTWATAPSSITVAPKPRLNVSAWTAFTPTFAGFGTGGSAPSAIDCWWRRNGDVMDLTYKLVTGTTAATTAQLGLPTINGTQATVVGRTTSYTPCGIWVHEDTASAAPAPVMISNNNAAAFLYIGNPMTGAVSPLSLANGNAVAQTGKSCGAFANSVPIVGWHRYGPDS